MLWCQQEKLPLDFVSWHEYFQPPEIIVKEADAFRAYLADFPELKRTVTSFMITEWNEAWWADRPQDHELGAAWCANSITRAFLPARIDRPCFFYVKQSDMNFRGDYSLLMKDNRAQGLLQRRQDLQRPARQLAPRRGHRRRCLRRRRLGRQAEPGWRSSWSTSATATPSAAPSSSASTRSPPP